MILKLSLLDRLKKVAIFLYCVGYLIALSCVIAITAIPIICIIFPIVPVAFSAYWVILFK